MEKKMIGLNTSSYTFKYEDYKKFVEMKQKLESKGTIEEIFINNGWGFEFKENRRVY